MIITITGIRAVAPESRKTIENYIAELVAQGATLMRFGGAMGVDTMALVAASRHNVRREVILPSGLSDAPHEARQAIIAHADDVHLMRLPAGSRSSYLARNRALVEGVRDEPRTDRVVGFTDGRKGGTAYTIEYAVHLGVAVAVVPVAAIGGLPIGIRSS